MTEIKINDCVYKIHPIYDLYAGSEDGNIINIIRRIPNSGRVHKSGYLMFNVRKHRQSGNKTYYVHRFIYECYNGVIPDGKVIDHINDNKVDNRLCNLQLLTQQQNCKKSVKNRDYTNVVNDFKNRRCVKATNKNNNEISYYNSLYSVNQHLGVNSGIVKQVCEGVNRYKSGVSKKDGCSYTFEYIKQEDLPANYKKSANIRPRKKQ